MSSTDEFLFGFIQIYLEEDSACISIITSRPHLEPSKAIVVAAIRLQSVPEIRLTLDHHLAAIRFAVAV